MLYYKLWLESRGRFIMGLIAVSMLTIVYIYLHPILIPGWKIALEQPNTFKPAWLSLGVNDLRFYIWHFLYDYQLQEAWVLFAIILSFGGLNSEYRQGNISYTLALPVRRAKWVSSGIIIAIAESLVIGLMPALLIPLIGPFYDLHYPVAQGLSHSFLMVTAGSIFILLANLLSLIVRSSYYVALSLVLLIIGLPYIVLQEYAREITHSSIAYKLDIAHVMAGSWLLSWNNVPWISLAVLFLISILIFMITVRYVKKTDY